MLLVQQPHHLSQVFHLAHKTAPIESLGGLESLGSCSPHTLPATEHGLNGPCWTPGTHTTLSQLMINLYTSILTLPPPLSYFLSRYLSLSLSLLLFLARSLSLSFLLLSYSLSYFKSCFLSLFYYFLCRYLKPSFFLYI